jgi:hypothetical protein
MFLDVCYTIPLLERFAYKMAKATIHCYRCVPSDRCPKLVKVTFSDRIPKDFEYCPEQTGVPLGAGGMPTSRHGDVVLAGPGGLPDYAEGISLPEGISSNTTKFLH